jgi:hypothetical protein
MNIRTRPCAALFFLTREPSRSDGEVPAYSWILRKYVWVRFLGAQDWSFPARVRGKCHFQAQLPCEHTAEESTKAYTCGSIPNQSIGDRLTRNKGLQL